MPKNNTPPRKPKGKKAQTKQRPHKKDKTPKGNNETEITILYANANMLKEKQSSLKSAAEAAQATVLTITETGGKPPNIEGYKWIDTKERKKKGGGGVAIAVREDLLHRTSQPTNLEKADEESAWIQINTTQNNKLFIGTYYGKQETTNEDTIKEEYATLTTQINTLKTRGDVLLTGDFNAKIHIKREGTTIQAESRNGKHLKELVNQTETTIENTEKDAKGMWTRQNRGNASEKSVIDYVLTAQTNKGRVTEIEIDEEGTYRLKANKDSDHNTIITKMETRAPKQERTFKRWKTTNKQGWKKFNEVINQNQETLRDLSYEECIKQIKDTMKNTIGEKTITTGRYKKRETKEVKEAREKVKQSKKEYKERINEGNAEAIKQALENTMTTQAELRGQIEESDKANTKEELNKMKREGGTKSNAFWQHRARVIGKHNKEEYDTLDEKGKPIATPEEEKEHIANYYENLYQARPAKPEEEPRTKQIEEETQKIKETMKNLPKPKAITNKEFKKAIKKLKRGKACGPDNIPNEIFIEANDQTKELLLHMFNRILATGNIPDEWQHGEITRLYKGKGKKGQCSNERGITLASNAGKLFERIINERIKLLVNMSDAQAGGRAGSSTTDHLLILSQTIKSALNGKKNMYVGFLDVTKAYDKAWITGIMHILHENGLNDSHWETVLKLNENLTAELRTKHGNTRKIKIKDSLRQGGVLAVLQYGIMMDQISKAIQEKNLGIKIEGTNTKIPSLLWVDDVLIMAETKEELQQMLDIINDIAAKYHIEFGMPKSNVMKIGGRKEAITMVPLGHQAMTQTTKYKYLGFNQTDDNKLDTHINETRSKTEGAYQKMLQVAGDEKFKNIELQTIWELIETEIAPIALNTAEVWDPTTKENEAHNKILDNILKRTLKVPISTPREALYIELGILDLEQRRKKNRINMEHRVNKKGTETTKTAMNAHIKGGWKELTDKLNSAMGTTNNTKPQIKNKINTNFKQRIEEEGKNKSKVQFLLNGRKQEWTVGERPKYLNELTRNQASALFKARTRMIRAKNNERGAHTTINRNTGEKAENLKCRYCNNTEIETQEHILNECEGIHTDETTKVTNEEIFEQYGTNTRETANKIIKIQDKMEIHIKRPTRKKYTAQKYPCTTCKAPCRSNQSAIECTTCEKWTHLKCTQLSQTEFHQHTP